MSRIGNKPIAIPAGVQVALDGTNVTVKGKKGTLSWAFDDLIKVEVSDKEVLVKRSSDDKKSRALHGLTRALLFNMVTGVSDGYEKALKIKGVGYRAQKQGKKLVLTLGYSHPVEIEEDEGITIEVPTPNDVIVKGISKEKVGHVAAIIRGTREPDAYKGKGVSYANEVIKLKEGKAGGKGKK